MGGADAGALAVDDRAVRPGAGSKKAGKVRSLSPESRRRDEFAWLCVGAGAGRLSAWPAGSAHSGESRFFGELVPGDPPANQFQARLPTVFHCLWYPDPGLGSADGPLACQSM